MISGPSRNTIVVVTAALLLLAGGCGAQELPTPSPSGPGSQSAPRAPSFAVASYESTEPGGDAAALEGRVTVRDGCLYVQPDRSPELILPIFPAGRLRVADEGLYFNSTLLVAGARVLLGGGGRESVPTNVQIPSECTDTRRLFQVANNP